MEFRKEEAEKIFQQYLPLASDYVLKHEESFRDWIFRECESQQKYIDEKAAQGLDYHILIGDIKREIEKLEAQIKQAEADYKNQYPEHGNTAKTVFHLDEQTGKLTPEELSNILPNYRFKTVRFQNTVLIDFWKLLKKDIVSHVIRANTPKKEERLALEARAVAIIQAAQEKAEADFQKLVSETLPRELAKYTKAEHAEFIREKLRELRQWLTDSWKPWYDFEAFSPKELVTHFMASDVVRTQAEAFLVQNLAERIKTVRYVECLVKLVDNENKATMVQLKSEDIIMDKEQGQSVPSGKEGKRLIKVCCKDTSKIIRGALDIGITNDDLEIFLQSFNKHKLTEFGTSAFRDRPDGIDTDKFIKNILETAELLSSEKLKAYFINAAFQDVLERNASPFWAIARKRVTTQFEAIKPTAILEKVVESQTFEGLFKSQDCIDKTLLALKELELINDLEEWIGKKNEIGVLYDVLTFNGYFKHKWPQEKAVLAIATRFNTKMSKRTTKDRPIDSNELRKELRNKLPKMS